MPIPVVCPGCQATFRVSDKYAGKKGPCPKCKAVISIPDKLEVKIDEPETAHGGKTSTGAPNIKPIKRTEIKLSAPMIAILVGGVVVTLFVTWLVGRQVDLVDSPLLVMIGLALVTPPICFAEYLVLRNQETPPYRGLGVLLRTLICSVVYIGLWVGFKFVPPEFLEQPWQWMFVVPPLVAFGGVAGFACYDLEFSTGLLHCGGYLLLTVMLRFIAGMPELWQSIV